MNCPKCHELAASFWRWFLWPGPRRRCSNCGTNLRYVGFYSQLAAHAILGPAIIIFGAAAGAPVWLSCLVLAVIVSFTAVLLPLRFGRYREIPAASPADPA
jgi:hypothetical protein